MDHEKLFESMLLKRKAALFFKMCADQLPLWAWWSAGFAAGSWKFLGFVMASLGMEAWTLHMAVEAAMGLALVGGAGYMFVWIASDMAADVASEGRRPFGEVAKLSGKARLSCLLSTLAASALMAAMGENQLGLVSAALGGSFFDSDLTLRSKMVSAICVDWAVIAMLAGPMMWIALGMIQWSGRVAARSKWFERRYGGATRASARKEALGRMARVALSYPKRRLENFAKKIVAKGLEDPAVRARIEAQAIDDAMAPRREGEPRRRSKSL